MTRVHTVGFIMGQAHFKFNKSIKLYGVSLTFNKSIKLCGTLLSLLVVGHLIFVPDWNLTKR
jgi:hypothetical protein